MDRSNLIFHPKRPHRPRRFFGFRGVVRRLRRPGADEGTSPRRSLPTATDEDASLRRSLPTATDRALQSERARFAATIDLELRLACRGEAAMRRELGDAARALVRRRAYRRLGFVRLSDYARERLGVSARTLQSAAWLTTRLDELPAISTAYDRSEISWAQARAICTVAVAADEEKWLAIARRSTVETLERLVARARHPDGDPAGTVEVPADPDGETNEIDGEPAIRWRFACPSRIRALWRRAVELASRAAGEPLAAWRAAEIIAAEGSSGRPPGISMGDRVLIEAIRLARRARRRRPDNGPCGRAHEATATGNDDSRPPMTARDPNHHGAIVGNEPSAGPPFHGASLSRAPHPDAPFAAAPFHAAHPNEPFPGAAFPVPPLPAHAAPEPSDPFALDARVAEAMRVLRTAEPRIGRLLRVAVDQRIYRSFGYPTIDGYVRERLGIAVRKAWALLKIEKATLRSDDFDRAYRDGRLSWVRALSLLPVLERSTAPAWIARAESVTVRRLCDEVDWVLASRDAFGPGASLAPPPIDSPLPSPIPVMPPQSSDQCRESSAHVRLQIRAHQNPIVLLSMDERQKALEVCDAEIKLTGPASVVALLRDVLDAFAKSDEPRWSALENLLRHVIDHWESTPRHHDPVFARDGWRCTVPACSSRRNLHDHHLRFRSRGGDNRRDNRTVVCAAHHLHGIHDGTIHASGTAPYAIEWQLGVRPGAPPFLRYVGDRYVGDRLCDPGDTGQQAPPQSAATPAPALMWYASRRDPQLRLADGANPDGSPIARS